MQVRALTLDAGDGVLLNLERVASEETEDGKRVYRMLSAIHGERGILPGAPMVLSFTFQRKAPEPPVERAEGAPPPEEPGEDEDWMVEGIASSTSQDWYGTEMNKKCLDGMSRQFNKGVALTPRHNGWFDPVEWNDVIGLTVNGVVEKAKVANPADDGEPGYTLTLQAILYKEEELAQALYRRLKKNQPIGLSIGGWFLDLRIITNEEEEVERIIVQEVLLDHTAVTRMPANPDSMGLKLLRSLADAALSKIRAVRTAEPPAPPATPEPTPGTQDARSTPEETSNPSGGNTPENLAPATPAEHSVNNPPDGGSEEDTMTPEQFAQLTASLNRLQEGQDALSARVEKVEQKSTAAPTPAADPPPAARTADPPPAAATETAEQRAARLEKENQALRGRVRALAGGGNRRALVPDHAFAPGSHEEGSQYRAIVSAAREEGRAIAVCEVSERFANVLSADRYDPKVKRSQLDEALRSLLDAAIADGMITDPQAEPVWS